MQMIVRMVGKNLVFLSKPDDSLEVGIPIGEFRKAPKVGQVVVVVRDAVKGSWVPE